MVDQKLGSYEVIGGMGTVQAREVFEMVGRGWTQRIVSAAFGLGGRAGRHWNQHPGCIDATPEAPTTGRGPMQIATSEDLSASEGASGRHSRLV